MRKRKGVSAYPREHAQRQLQIREEVVDRGTQHSAVVSELDDLDQRTSLVQVDSSAIALPAVAGLRGVIGEQHVEDDDRCRSP